MNILFGNPFMNILFGNPFTNVLLGFFFIGRGPTAMADGYGRDLKAADRFTTITDFTKRNLQENLSRFFIVVQWI